MRWSPWLAAAAVVLGLVLIFAAVIRPSPETVPHKAALNAGPAHATPPPAALISPGPAAVSEPPPRITVHGVLSQGRDSFSQALLDVDGGPQQLYRIGEQVAQGWSLQAIQSDHVILAKGAAHATFAMAAAASSSLAGGGQGQSSDESAPAPAAAQSQPHLPGFVPGPPPRIANGDAAAASERNRSFLQAVQGGMRARARQQ